MNRDPLPFDEATDLDPNTEERDDTVIATALRWSLILFCIAALLGITIFAGLTWMSRKDSQIRETKLAEIQIREMPSVNIPNVTFTDVTASSGIHFRHENAARGEKLLPETMGGGCAFFDFDNDGNQDLLLVNGLDKWPWDPPPAKADAPSKPPTMFLYRNNGHGQFQDVTAGSGLDVPLYGMGVAVGDYDNDGLDDVFVTAVGRNHLFRNLGNGKFQDVTDAAGVGGVADQWSTSCGWFDYDNDGDLDLFVGNYVVWTRAFDAGQNFQLTGGGRAYGRPQNFEGTFPYLYRNDGNGRFTDVTTKAGIQIRNPATQVPLAKTLGVTFADVDSDGWIDILVANDTVQNFLFHNEQNGTFRETAAVAGLAFDLNGSARGAMGIDVARFRNDAVLGVAIGNFANEMTALYVSKQNQMQFMDEAIATGIGPPTRTSLTFGLFYFDFDLDGRLDLLTANGHLEKDINRVQPSQFYEQPPHLFWNCGVEQDTEFIPVSVANSGPDLFKPLVGRGAAYADIDSDGDLDVLVTAAEGNPRLLRNDNSLGNHWLRFKLTGERCNRDAIGAWVEVQLKGRVLRRQVMPTRSYLSQVELPVTFGLGKDEHVESIVIYWPDGSQQRVAFAGVDRLYQVRQTSATSISQQSTEGQHADR